MCLLVYVCFVPHSFLIAQSLNSSFLVIHFIFPSAPLLDSIGNLRLAMNMAEKWLGIDQYITPTDIAKLDEKSMVVRLKCYVEFPFLLFLAVFVCVCVCVCVCFFYSPFFFALFSFLFCTCSPRSTCPSTTTALWTSCAPTAAFAASTSSSCTQRRTISFAKSTMLVPAIWSCASTLQMRNSRRCSPRCACVMCVCVCVCVCHVCVCVCMSCVCCFSKTIDQFCTVSSRILFFFHYFLLYRNKKWQIPWTSCSSLPPTFQTTATPSMTSTSR